MVAIPFQAIGKTQLTLLGFVLNTTVIPIFRTRVFERWFTHLPTCPYYQLSGSSVVGCLQSRSSLNFQRSDSTGWVSLWSSCQIYPGCEYISLYF